MLVYTFLVNSICGQASSDEEQKFICLDDGSQDSHRAAEIFAITK